MIKPAARLLFVYSLLAGGFATAADQCIVGEKLSDLLVDHEAKLALPSLSLSGQGWSRDQTLRLGLDYDISFKHSENPDTYLRKERTNTAIRMSGPVTSRLNLSSGLQVTAEFVREFPRNELLCIGDRKISPVAPYNFSDMPFTSQKAQALRPNKEYFSFTPKFPITLGITPGQSQLNTHFLGTLNASIGVTGDFMLQVYRLEGDKVKVIASALNKKQVRVNGVLKWVPDVTFFSYSRLNNLVEGALEVNIISIDLLNYTWDGSLYSVAYEYDLSKKAARRAYDDLMNPSLWSATDLRVLNPLRDHSGEKVREILSGKIDSSLKYASTAGAGVSQDYLTHATYTQRAGGSRWNVHFTKGGHSWSATDMNYTITREAGGEPQYYKIGTLHKNNSRRIGVIDPWREFNINRIANVVMTTDANHNITGLAELSFSYERQDERLNRTKPNCEIACLDEVASARSFTLAMIPSADGQRPEIPEIFEKVRGRGTFVDVDTYFSADSIKEVEKLSADTIREVAAGVTNNMAVVEAMVTLFDGSKAPAQRWQAVAEVSEEQELHTYGAIIAKRLLEAAVGANNNVRRYMGSRVVIKAKDMENYVSILSNGQKTTPEIEDLMENQRQILHRDFDIKTWSR